MSIKGYKEHLPEWLKVPMPTGVNYSKVKNLIAQHGLNTICSSGNCPNKGECWSAGTATFMILGDKCTRNCSFCFVKSLKPEPVDWNEPERLAKTIHLLGLKHCVITSVARDDLKDGGAAFWAETIRTVKKINPSITMEVLIPDFEGDQNLIEMIIRENPEVISHNVETVERISPKIRSKATYRRSLDVLAYIASSGIIAKSGIMLGLGETEPEVFKTLDELYEVHVKVVTIGQYLPPSEKHTTLVEYVKPEVFRKYRAKGLELGFKHVESGALVRSSYHAERHVNV
jgi:lipoic acid synthetase